MAQEHLFLGKHFENIILWLSTTANRYFAYGLPSDLDPEEIMKVFVPENLHQLARDVPKYYEDISTGGDVVIKPDHNTAFTVEVSNNVSWAMPKTRPQDEIMASDNPTWLRIMNWMRWRIEQGQRWDKLFYAIDQINDRLKDPRAALFYMPSLEYIVQQVHLPDTTRKRWDNAARRPDPTEALPFLVKQLAAESGVLITETMLMPKEMPKVSSYPVRMRIRKYPPCHVENLNGEKAALYTWGANRPW